MPDAGQFRGSSYTFLNWCHELQSLPSGEVLHVQLNKEKVKKFLKIS